MKWYKEKLAQLLVKSKSVLKGDFVLKSGLKTDIYIDCRQLFLNSQYLSTIIPMYIDEIREILDSDTVLCGIPTSGLVLMGGLLQRCAIHRDVRGIYLRPETKDHGTKQNFEGDVRTTDKIILLDDVVTSGSTIIKAISQLTERNLKVTDIIVLLDRSDSFKDLMKNSNINYLSLLTMEELCKLTNMS